MSYGSGFDPLNPPLVPTEPQRRKLSPLGCIAIVFGGFLLIFIGLVVFAAVALNRITTRNKQFRAENAQWQLTPAKPLDTTTKESISSIGAKSASDPNFKSIERSIRGEGDNYEIQADIPRFVQAISASNATELDWATQVIAQSQINQDHITPPPVQDTNKLLHLEWIKPDEEVRAFITAYNYQARTKTIYALWLIKKDEGWRVYDCKDLLETHSDADYMAVAYNLLDGDSLYRFNEDIGELDDPKRIVSYARSARVETPFRDMAYVLAIGVLIDQNAWKEVDELAKMIDGSKCSYADYFQARANANLGNYPQAILHFKKLLDAYGWFPGLPQMLGTWRPEDPEQREWLEDLIAAELIVGGDYSLKLSDSEKHSSDFHRRLASRIADQPSILSICESIFVNGSLDESQSIAAFLEATQDNVKFSEVRPMLQGIRAYADKEYETSARLLLPWVEQKLRTDEKEGDGNKVFDGIVIAFAESLLKTDAIEQVLNAADNPTELAEVLVTRTIWSADNLELPVEGNVSKLIEWIEKQNIEIENQQALNLLKCLSLKDNSPTKALDTLLELHAQIKRQVLSEGDANEFLLAEVDYTSSSIATYTSTIYKLIDHLVKKLDNWNTIRESLDTPDYAFVLRANQCNLPCDQARLEEAIDWYKTQVPEDNLWLLYFQSQLFYSKGQWEQADEKLSSFQNATKDSTVDSSFGIYAEIVSEDLTYSSINDRLLMAARCNKLPQLINRVSEEQPQLLSLLQTLRYQSRYVTDVEAITSLIPQDDAAIVNAAVRFRVNYFEQTNKMDLAWQECQKLIQSDLPISENDSYLAMKIAYAAGKLDELDTKEFGPDERRALDIVEALSTNDRSRFERIFQPLTQKELNKLWWSKLSNFGEFIVEKGWEDIISDAGFPLASYSEYNVVLLPIESGKPIEAIRDDLSRALERFQAKLAPHETVSKASAAWSVPSNSRLESETTGRGSDSDRSSESMQKSISVLLFDSDASEKLHSQSSCWPASSRVIALIESTGKQQTWSPTMRSIVAVLGSSKQCRGIFDSAASAFWEPSRWKLLAEPEGNVLVDPENPVPLFFYSLQPYEQSSVDSVEVAKEYRLLTDIDNLIMESVRVRAVKEATASRDVELEVLEDSLLDQRLRKGSKVIRSIYQLTPANEP